MLQLSFFFTTNRQLGFTHVYRGVCLAFFSFDVSNDFHFSCPGGQVGSLLCFISLFYFIHRAIPERRAMNHRDKFK
jgi:hypothetical protein